MVGPSVTQEDRERFFKRLKIGFALFVGLSMGLVTTWGGAEPLIIGAAAVGGTVVGAALAKFTLPESIAETPYDEHSYDRRGPKPGERTKKRRSGDDTQRRATDGDGDAAYRDRK